MVQYDMVQHDVERGGLVCFTTFNKRKDLLKREGLFRGIDEA